MRELHPGIFPLVARSPWPTPPEFLPQGSRLKHLPQTQARESFLLGNGKQLDFLPDADPSEIPAEAYAAQESRGIFTGERLFQQNPRLYKGIVKLLGGGIPFWTIAETLSVSVNTVRAVREREGVTIDTEKNRIGGIALDVARLGFEELKRRLSDLDELAKLSAKDIAIMTGIATQNAQLLLGGPTARIETIEHGAPGHEDYLRYIAELKNVTATGLAAETPALKEATAAALPAAPGAVIEIDAAGEPRPSSETSQ